ncbi:pyridoxamine 5'-phosphate oxidase family protein [Nitratifractor sp.]
MPLEKSDLPFIRRLLDDAEYGTLALFDGETPYAVPVNFVRIGEEIFFHGRRSGRKMRAIQRHPLVSFSVVRSYSLIDSTFSSTEGIACPATQFFASVHLEGTASLVEERKEKAAIFEALMAKLQPAGGYRSFDDPAYDKALEKTAVVRIVPTKIDRKLKFGQKLPIERYERILKHLRQRGNPLDLETVRIMELLRKREV